MHIRFWSFAYLDPVTCFRPLNEILEQYSVYCFFSLSVLDGSKEHFSKCPSKASIVTTSLQPFSLKLHQIFWLSIIFFNIGTTGFKSFS